MLDVEETLSLFEQWLYKQGFMGSTVPGYKSGLRLVFRHLGTVVTQDSVDRTFEALRLSSRYAAARRAWSLFRDYAQERGVEIPLGPVDKRLARRPASKVITHELPLEVLKIVHSLAKTHKLTCIQLAQIYWNDLRIIDGWNGSKQCSFPHPNGDKAHFVVMDQEVVDILRNYAQPSGDTPLIPLKPGDSVPFPLEVVLSGR